MVGKQIAKTFYIHKNYMHLLDSELKALYNEASSYLIPLKNKKWNLLKFNKEKSLVSFLYYPRFDSDAHPELEYSIYVNLALPFPKARIIRGGGKILHRKELFIGEDYPNYPKFTELTRQEELSGLLDKEVIFNGKKLGSIIGQKEIWEQWLEYKGVEIKSHKLFLKNGKLSYEIT